MSDAIADAKRAMRADLRERRQTISEAARQAAAEGIRTQLDALVERLKVNGALARAAIKELQEKGLIKMVSYHHTQRIYTRDVGSD